MTNEAPPPESDSPVTHSKNPLPPAEDRPFWKNPFFIATIFFLILIPALRPLLVRVTRRIPQPPPVYGKLNHFQLIDQNGQPFGLKQMKGKVHVVGLFFTRCPTICPKLTKSMRKLQKIFQFTRDKSIAQKVRLLSISVDPTHDTPDILRKYAKSYQADLTQWRFLTGTEKAVDRIARQEFKTALFRPKSPASQPSSQPNNPLTKGGKGKKSLMEISHTGKLILVDQKGQIRGYYNIEKKGLNELYHRTLSVLWERYAPKRKAAPPKKRPAT